MERDDVVEGPGGSSEPARPLSRRAAREAAGRDGRASAHGSTADRAAAAARTTATSPPPPGRAGRGHVARRRVSPWTSGVVLVSVLAGGLFALSATTAKGTPLRADRADQLGFARQLKARNAASQARLDDLNRQIDEITSARAGDATVKNLKSRFAAAAPAAGLGRVTGPTLQVTLDDAPRTVKPPQGIPPDYLVVHQQDVQAVVNALWRGGAEAMMLMDQRVISTSAVRCVGNTLILQGRVYSPPYRIRAIGNLQKMEDALDSSPEVSVYKEFVPLVKLGYSVDRIGTRTFPAFQRPSLSYARPLTADDAQPGASGTATGSAGSGSAGTGSGASSGSTSSSGSTVSASASRSAG